SGDGMLTSVWGPPLWHYLHVMSFNYPVKPTAADKKHYRDFICNLRNVLPCHYCRQNLKKNLKMLPLTNADLKNRDRFSRWVYKLHELVNTMLGKTSGLKFCDVRERYEHFRSRCTQDSKVVSGKVLKEHLRRTQKKEKGCTEPLYGKKSQCIVKIVPQDKKNKTFQMDDKCIKKRVQND
ncbi:MAG: FAD-linked sulfhydryl oxidase, partial [Promethearchaeota archaeon]